MLAPQGARKFPRFPQSLFLLLKNLLYLAAVSGFFLGWVPLNIFAHQPVWPTKFALHQVLGLSVGTTALAVYLWCVWLLMRRGNGTPLLFDPPQRLVQCGPYRWVRNPMHLASATIVAAEAVFLPSWHVAIYALSLACALQLLVMLQEESDLSFRFGAFYDDYRHATPRWWPRRPKPTDDRR